MVKFAENKLMFMIIVVMLAAQFVICFSVPLGQGMFLVCNLGLIFRDRILERPKADKIKNSIFAVVSLGLMTFALI